MHCVVGCSSPSRTRYEQLSRFLTSGATLVVVDNCEHLIDGVAELVDRLLKDSYLNCPRYLRTNFSV